MYIYVYVYIILTSQKLRKQISKTNHNNGLSTAQKNRTANVIKKKKLISSIVGCSEIRNENG